MTKRPRNQNCSCRFKNSDLTCLNKKGNFSVLAVQWWLRQILPCSLLHPDLTVWSDNTSPFWNMRKHSSMFQLLKSHLMLCTTLLKGHWQIGTSLEENDPDGEGIRNQVIWETFGASGEISLRKRLTREYYRDHSWKILEKILLGLGIYHSLPVGISQNKSHCRRDTERTSTRTW